MNHRRWNPGPVPTADRVAVQAAENERIIIDQIWITNKDSSNRNVDIHHIPSGDTGSVDNFCLLHDHTINSKTYEVIDASVYLDPGDQLTVSASAANAIITTFYGRVFSSTI